ncbi:LacI family transcriptional regulator [Microbacterium sp. CBA3102]|uniref:LacI family DNA-binding transcriptional regulator n=1 Tax=Microbacterium sp. CBA3102 TaxID=2603598 RepID=UPI0011BBC5EF|nr:LacI family DNA-binding transcriptional regulator [Microbacterium sp. CBA3102]QEA29452.1 LacI family transcriptional regulator [Microbacterium sp. CBA3102]
MKESSTSHEATVSDVARLARVSKATAARALGDYGAVSDAVRDRVQKAADDLGYRPNALARTMSTGRSHTLGIIIGDIENPYFAAATRGAADVAAEAGYDLILSNSDEEPEIEAKAVAVQLAKRVDGLLIAPASSLTADNLQPVLDARRPLVLFDRTVPGLEVDAVVTDNRSGARQLTELLLRAGHRRIAFISTLTHPRAFRAGELLSSSAVAERVEGFTQTLTAAGVPRPEDCVHLNARHDGVDTVASRILGGDHPVTAIVASDSLVALAAFQTARRMGVSIPDQLSLVAFDDADWMSVTTPDITVMEQPISEIGAHATRTLLRRIAGDGRNPETTVLPQQLVERGSVAAPRR